MRRRLIASTLLVVISLLPFLVHMMGGTGSRYFTDDYCIHLEAASANPLALTADWYETSGGRVAQYLSLAVLFKGGVGVARVTPALLLTVWIIGLGWLGRESALVLKLPALLGIAGALFIGSTMLAGAPNMVQAVYWLTGILTYFAPCVFGTFAAALIVRAGRRNTISLVSGCLIFFLCLAGGLFNEPFVLMQGALLAGGFLVTWLYLPRRALNWALGTAAAATALALIIIVIAPGNSVRQDSFVAAPSFTVAMVQSVQYALAFGFLALYTNPIGVLAVVFIGFSFPTLVQRYSASTVFEETRYGRRHYLAALALCLLILLAVSAAFMLPGVYATQSPPPARGFIMLLWAYLPLAIALGALLRLSLANSSQWDPRIDRWNIGVAVAAIVIHMLWASVSGMSTAVYALHYGSEWDARTAELAAASETDDITLPALQHDLALYTGLRPIGTDPAYWVNVCAAEYFGVGSLRTES